MKFGVAFLACSVLALATPAFAATNLVNNGDFSTAASNMANKGSNNNFQISTSGVYGTMDGWYSDRNVSYNILFNTSNATSLSGNAWGNYSRADSNNAVQGYNSAAGNTWNAQYLESYAAPSGNVGASGNFVGLDGDSVFTNRSLNQAINGLVTGQQYTLAFDWATGALKSGSVDATSAGADITLGGLNLLSVNSTSVPTASWTRASTTFTYTGAGSLLSFVAKGTPNGAPPMFLLDNVSLTAAVPEPATWAMMLVGFGAVGLGMRRKRTSVPTFA